MVTYSHVLSADNFKRKKSRVKILGNKFTLSLVTVQAACNSVVCYKVVDLSMGLWKLN